MKFRRFNVAKVVIPKRSATATTPASTSRSPKSADVSISATARSQSAPARSTRVGLPAGKDLGNAASAADPSRSSTSHDDATITVAATSRSRPGWPARRSSQRSRSASAPVRDSQDHPRIDNDNSAARGLNVDGALTSEMAGYQLVGLRAAPAVGGAANPGETQPAPRHRQTGLDRFDSHLFDADMARLGSRQKTAGLLVGHTQRQRHPPTIGAKPTIPATAPTAGCDARPGRLDRYIGGTARESPGRLGIPGSASWHVAVDMQGLSGDNSRWDPSGQAERSQTPAPIRQSRPMLRGTPQNAAEVTGLGPAEARRDRDVFISRATEDNETAVRALAHALRARASTSATTTPTSAPATAPGARSTPASPPAA